MRAKRTLVLQTVTNVLFKEALIGNETLMRNMTFSAGGAAGWARKETSVVMSQIFGVPAFPVDTHIHRLMHRWKLSNGKSVEQTERDAKRLFPENTWNKLHLQIIYFGREYCPARGHNEQTCPICSKI